MLWLLMLVGQVPDECCSARDPSNPQAVSSCAMINNQLYCEHPLAGTSCQWGACPTCTLPAGESETPDCSSVCAAASCPCSPTAWLVYRQRANGAASSRYLCSSIALHEYAYLTPAGQPYRELTRVE